MHSNTVPEKENGRKGKKGNRLEGEEEWEDMEVAKWGQWGKRRGRVGTGKGKANDQIGKDRRSKEVEMMRGERKVGSERVRR